MTWTPQTMGRKGGSRNTPAQQAARAANGRKGGRPKGSKDSRPRARRKGKK